MRINSVEECKQIEQRAHEFYLAGDIEACAELHDHIQAFRDMQWNVHCCFGEIFLDPNWSIEQATYQTEDL